MAPRPPAKSPSQSRSPLSKTYKTPHKHNKAPTKRLKRASRHATLLSRISKTAPGSKIVKRRRPSKKLVTGLGDLAEALPGTGASTAGQNGDVGARDVAEGKIKHKSLKSRPGARKKKEKVVAMEMERFKQNMALMFAASTGPAHEPSEGKGTEMDGLGSVIGERKGGSAETWAAIRGFISQTMEQRPDGKTGMKSKS